MSNARSSVGCTVKSSELSYSPLPPCSEGFAHVLNGALRVNPFSISQASRA